LRDTVDQLKCDKLNLARQLYAVAMELLNKTQEADELREDNQELLQELRSLGTATRALNLYKRPGAQTQIIQSRCRALTE
jgi:hypothetical protein